MIRSSKIFVQVVTCGRTKGSLAPCLVAARAVRQRPRLAGTRQYIFFSLKLPALYFMYGRFRQGSPSEGNKKKILCSSGHNSIIGGLVIRRIYMQCKQSYKVRRQILHYVGTVVKLVYLQKAWHSSLYLVPRQVTKQAVQVGSQCLSDRLLAMCLAHNTSKVDINESNPKRMCHDFLNKVDDLH